MESNYNNPQHNRHFGDYRQQENNEHWEKSQESRKNHGMWGNRNNPDRDNSSMHQRREGDNNRREHQQGNTNWHQSKGDNWGNPDSRQQQDHNGIVAWGSPDMENGYRQDNRREYGQGRGFGQNSIFRQAENEVYHSGQQPGSSEGRSSRGESRYSNNDQQGSYREKNEQNQITGHRYGAGSYEAELNRDYGQNGIFGGGSRREQGQDENSYRPANYSNSGNYGVSNRGNQYSDSGNRTGGQQRNNSFENNQTGRGNQHNRYSDYSGYGITNMGGDYDREGRRNKYLEDRENSNKAMGESRNQWNNPRQTSRNNEGSYSRSVGGNTYSSGERYDRGMEDNEDKIRNYYQNSYRHAQREYGRDRNDSDFGSSNARSGRNSDQGSYGVGNWHPEEGKIKEQSSHKKSHEEEFGFRERRGGRDNTSFGGNDRY